VMTRVVGLRVVVFSQVSAVVPCWAVRWRAPGAELFARILHANTCGKAGRFAPVVAVQDPSRTAGARGRSPRTRLRAGLRAGSLGGDGGARRGACGGSECWAFAGRVVEDLLRRDGLADHCCGDVGESLVVVAGVAA
jgi:hypothetical protein